MRLTVKKILPAACILLVILMPVSCCVKNSKEKSSECSTVYPVVMVHGIAFRDSTMGFKYWGDIPEQLEKHGAKVYLGKQDAYGSIASNAVQLKKNILRVLEKTGDGKVNIIAHSRGGIEARYMITKLGMADKVASLTTVSTPHRGSIMADIILNRIKDKKKAGYIIDLYSKIIGDRHPDCIKAGLELTVEYMGKFNLEVPDMQGVYYQSYGSVISSSYPNPLWVALYETMKKTDGENDGVVSETSCRWGNFRGLVTCKGKPFVSHSDIIGMHMLTGEYCFDAPEFYIQVVSDLRAAGY